MRINLFWFGHPARSPFESQVEDYRRRVQRRWPAQDVPLRPHGRGRSEQPAKARAQEASALGARRQPGFSLIALDEGGKTLSSKAFAGYLLSLETDGARGVDLVIGSDLGLDPVLLGDADLVLALGPMTLAHQLARLVLWEQLFRATDILGSGRYHRS